MKKHHHLSLIAALVLSACGGGSDGSNSDNGGNGAPADITLSGRALSSDYLVGRTVCLDLNANQQCDSGEPQTTTDSQGRFSFTLPETQQADARQAWAILAAPAISSKAAARSVNQATPTLLGYVDGAEFVVSPYTHQLVTSTDPEQRKTQYQSSIATKEKQLIANELGLTTQEASAQKLFGDYLAAGDTHSAALADEAATKEQQLIEASALQAELAAALATDNPQGWQLVTVSIRNLREYNRNQDIWQQIRLQEVVYSKRVDAIETTRTESTRWLLDEQGGYDAQQPLRRFIDEEHKNWDSKQYNLHSAWDWTYDESGNATVKGESIRSGTFSQDANGLYSYHTTEFTNEGTPVPQDTTPSPEESYCEGFDIQAEFARWQANPSLTALDQCVGNVLQSDDQESLDSQGAWTQHRALTFWLKGKDPINPNGPPSSYETRTSVITAQGDTQFVNQLDNQALTINAPALGQSPFNLTRDDKLSYTGDSTIKLAQPICGGCAATELDSSIPRFGKVELQNYNPTHWRSLAGAYLEQDYLKKQTGDFTLANRFYQLDVRQPDGLNQPLFLKYAGNSEPFMTQDWQFDSANQTLTATHHYAPVANVADVWPVSHQVMQGEELELKATVKLVQSNGLPSATQTMTIDGGNAISTPTFAEGLFSSPLRWSVQSSDTSPDGQEFAELLFGTAPLSFHASREAGISQGICGGNPATVRQELLFAPVGGDMVVSVVCDGVDVAQQYLLRVITPFNGTAFQAELQRFVDGTNIYQETPSSRVSFTFTRQ
ncbi:hypothetical protein ACET9V_06895 [Aeromonas caviae]|uniref:hypothetical protein n=1 Tax=Aeromonas caviae TaxID=648 RepID=UPI0038D1197A